jgi:hypothetical protein
MYSAAEFRPILDEYGMFGQLNWQFCYFTDFLEATHDERLIGDESSLSLSDIH